MIDKIRKAVWFLIAIWQSQNSATISSSYLDQFKPLWQLTWSLWRVTPKFVTKLLTDEQKERQKQITTDLLEFEVNFFKSVIIGSEMWLWPRGKSPISAVEDTWFSMTKNAKQVCCPMKVTLTVFFNYEVIVHHE